MTTSPARTLFRVILTKNGAWWHAQVEDGPKFRGPSRESVQEQASAYLLDQPVFLTCQVVWVHRYPTTPVEIQDQWRSYLADSVTYGSYQDRKQEYAYAYAALTTRGLLDENDVVCDVGAAQGDMGRYLRERGWQGAYLPVDGALQGVDLEVWRPNFRADIFVCLETLEHLHDWRSMLSAMISLARKAVIVSTPNADVVDVIAADWTHVSPIAPVDLQGRFHMQTELVEFNGRGAGDTLFGVWPR